LAEEEPLKSAARLVHFSELLDESGTMRFDYTLKPGLATSRNALRLMQLIGIDL
jgi:DNA mismatch repair ATPase MutS